MIIDKTDILLKCVDIVLIIFLLLISFFNICSYVQSLPDPLDHNFHPLLSFLYPAIFFASGKGLGTIDIKKFPNIEKFIARETDSLDIITLPNDITLQPTKTAYELSHLYLLYTVGWIWRLWGVSIASLMILTYIFYILNSVFLFLLCRQFLGSILAFLATLFTVFSPPFLTTSISLRDYSKGPFILLFLVLLIWIIKNRYRPCLVLLLSSACAAVLGLGAGFRQDCLIAIPLFLFVILLLLPWNRQQRPVHIRLGSIVLFVLIFFILARPVLLGISLEGGEVNAHTFVQGISTEAESSITFGDASYAIVPNTWDTTTYATLVTYARRTGNSRPMINPYSAEYQKVMGNDSGPLCFNSQLYFTGAAYGQSGHQYLLNIMRFFPADLLVRSITTIRHIIEMPYRCYAFFDARSLHKHGPIAWIHTVNKAIAKILFKTPEIFGLVLLLAILLQPKFHIIVFAFMCTYLMSYPSILLQDRHYYHMVFVPYLLFFGTVSFYKLIFQPGPALDLSCSRMPMFQMFLAGGGIIATSILAFAILLGWQHRQVDLLANQICVADREPIVCSITVSEDIAHVAPIDSLPQLREAATLPAGEVAWEYLAVALDANGKDIPVSIHYDKSRSAHDLSSTFTVKAIPSNEETEVLFYFPVYEVDLVYSPHIVEDVRRMFPKLRDFFEADGKDFEQQECWKRGRFVGISLPAECLHNFRGLYRVSGKLPDILPYISIPRNERYLVRHKSTPRMRENLACVYEFLMCTHLGYHYAEKAYLELIAKHSQDLWLFQRYHDLLFRLAPAKDYIKKVSTTADRFEHFRHPASVWLSESGNVFEKKGNLTAAYQAYLAAAKIAPDERWYAIRLEQLAQYAEMTHH